MATQTQKAALVSRGWMSFTVANGGLLELGGASQTAPTSHLSAGVSDATGFLATGIPQKLDKSAFADVVSPTDVRGHAIKTAFVTFVSDGGTSPGGRFMCDGSTPTTSLGKRTLVGDTQEFWNCRDEIFRFKWFNRSGNNAVVEVEVFE